MSIKDETAQNKVAAWTLVSSGMAIMILAMIAISEDKTGKNALSIFNTTLPVFASWVGTVLAFYFGKENFKSANKQVQEMVSKMGSGEKEKEGIVSIMRSIFATALFKVPRGEKAGDITLLSLKKKFDETKFSRLPILDSDNKIIFMVHKSSIMDYLLEGKGKDTLDMFIEQTNYSFGEGHGFMLVSKKASLKEAKEKMEQNSLCKDIFISENGDITEPIIGWISNERLLKYLDA